MNEKTLKKDRSLNLDAIRGVGIVLMVIFHFTFDLDHFDFIDVPIGIDIKYKIWRNVIMTLFLIPVGIGLVLAYKNGINWNKLKKRLLILGIASLGITAVSLIIFPDNWIYFGIIHFILLSSIIGLLFIPYPKFSLLLAVVILAFNGMGILTTEPLFIFLWNYLPFLPYFSNDTVHFIPWISVVLIGIFLGHYQWYEVVSIKSRFANYLATLGRHSLIIYLVHQLILYNLVWGVWLILN